MISFLKKTHLGYTGVIEEITHSFFGGKNSPHRESFLVARIPFERPLIYGTQ